MKKLILCLFLIFVSISGFAHQTNTSSTVLIEKDDLSWILQISASLTAFQQEIQLHYAETPYQTPEEFRAQVLQHIKKNFELVLNKNISIELTGGTVQLGHETKVVFEVHGLPNTIEQVDLTNTIFKDIYRNQNSLFLFKQNFIKKKFTLNAEKDHKLTLVTSDNEFIEQITEEASVFPSGYIAGFIVLAGLIYFIVLQYKRKTL